MILLFGSIFWTVVIILVLIGAFIWAEVNENGYIAIIFSFAIAVVLYLWGPDLWDKITSVVTLGMVFLYLGIGLFHSMFRTFVFARKKIKKENQERGGFDIKLKSGWIANLKFDLQGNVFRWWFMWPISLLVWIFSDFIKDLYDWVYGKLKAMYEGIFDLGVKSALKESKNEINKTN